ncbi:hypothetical protein [Ornithinicoccus hortensis]|uniref:DNA polymerase III epsilon subunit-like protein n=1 Tax=Ornithinicoccus hortensis TaxID=82346 RepID=A0A542YTK1_9MICO|nr:hypothetical protein [Ornithinicoccus hortensis]TQL51419.1 DNA polymerase III epsilon subunit-like protein [Ornithinicoccus hortensis]
MTRAEREAWTYVVTDIEADGPWPGPNSMLSFASVAISLDGTERGSFEAVLEPLPGASPSPKTLEWFQHFPEAWEAATADPEPVPSVLARYAAWVRSLPHPRMFAAAPLAFDAAWVDYYLRRFTRYGITQGPYEDDPLFDGPGLCIRSYAAGVTGTSITEMHTHHIPPEWFGDVAHTHRAIDDARGYANLLLEMSRRADSRAQKPSRSSSPKPRADHPREPR